MSQTYAVKINTEHSDVEFDHEMIGILRGKDLKPQVEELWSVGTEKHGQDDSGYLLAVVSHWTEPFEHVDVGSDERDATLVCGCTGYYFNCIEHDLGAKIDDCKHCERVHKLQKTKVDDSQATLEL